MTRFLTLSHYAEFINNHRNGERLFPVDSSLGKLSSSAPPYLTLNDIHAYLNHLYQNKGKRTSRHIDEKRAAWQAFYERLSGQLDSA